MLYVVVGQEACKFFRDKLGAVVTYGSHWNAICCEKASHGGDCGGCSGIGYSNSFNPLGMGVNNNQHILLINVGIIDMNPTPGSFWEFLWVDWGLWRAVLVLLTSSTGLHLLLQTLVNAWPPYIGSC